MIAIFIVLKMAKLSHTSQTAITMTFLVMNLSTHLSRLLCAFFCLFLKSTPFLSVAITKNNIGLKINNKNLSLTLTSVTN